MMAKPMTSTTVKICGLVAPEEAAAVARLGADWIGLNFWPGSKRHIGEREARAVVQAVRDAAGGVALVGVFVNQAPTHMIDIAGELGLDWVQLHGDEDGRVEETLIAARCRLIRALPMTGADAIARIAATRADVVLIDAPHRDRGGSFGGSGQTFAWTLARDAVTAGHRAGKRVLLAGGLSPDNVAAAVAQARPDGVDVASGVERARGSKDIDAVRRFIAQARAAEVSGQRNNHPHNVPGRNPS